MLHFSDNGHRTSCELSGGMNIARELGGRRECRLNGRIVVIVAFELFELKIFVTVLLRDYKLSFDEDDAHTIPNVKYPFGMRLDGPLHIELEKRCKDSD